MSNLEDFKSLEPQLSEIAKEAIKEPNLPVDIAVQEAEDLCPIAKADELQLATSGLNISLIDELPVRIGALRHAQAAWMQEYDKKTESEEQWKVLAPEANELRNELLHYFRYAYRNNKDLTKIVNRIARGSGNADLIQDLDELAMLGRNNPGPLEKVNLNMQKLEIAETLSDECGELLGQVNGARAINNKPAKQMRDRAFTCLKKAVDDIRDAGRFVFWKNEERQLLYGSKYFRNLRANRKKTETFSAEQSLSR